MFFIKIFYLLRIYQISNHLLFTMLKKLFVVLVLLFCQMQFVSAQVEIGYDDFAHNGDGYIYAVKYFSPGQMTVDKLDKMNWDISSYSPESFDTVRFYSKNRSRYGNLFPNAEIVKFQTKKNMEFLTIDSSKVRMQGIINDYLGLKAAVVLVFPTDMVRYKFPLKVGTVVSDSISKRFVSSYGLAQFADSVRIDLDLSYQSVFDTCATIKTPTDTYQALREKNTVYKKMIAYKNSHLMGWTPAPEFSSKNRTVYYRWYAKKNGIPVLEAEADTKGNVTIIRYQYRQPMVVTLEKQDVNCKGKNTGSIQVNVSGGTPDYKYIWSHGKKGRKLDSLKAGTYTVEVTDSKGLKQTKSIEINEPSKDLTLKIDYRNIRCYGDHDATLKAIVDGGTAPYYIVWSDDTEAPELSGKGTGIYGCIVKDAQRCFVWDSVQVTAPQIPLQFSPKVEHSPCFGEAKGALTFDIQGGDAPYKFELNGKVVDQHVENLMSGNYNMKVTDKWGCVIERTADIRQPEKVLEATGDVKHVTCSGGSNGSITLKVTGGSPGYTYSWSNDQASKDIVNVSPGVYHVTIKDAHKCSITKSFTITAPPNVLSVHYTVTDVTCKGGSNGQIKAEGVGGVGPYTFVWNNRIKTENLENIKAGDYNLKLTDHNNCSVIETVIVSEPETAPEVEIEAENSPCHGKKMGSLTAKVSGGKAPYRYVWENNDNSSVHRNLSAGNYTVKVYDSDNCLVEKSASVTQPDKDLYVNIETSGTTCSDSDDGHYRIVVSGGVPGYEYKISDGSETPSQQGMKPGKYTATIIDQAGCIVTKDFEIVKKPEITIDVKSQKPTPNKPDGTAEVSVSGGTFPYQIRWNDGYHDFKRKQMSVGEYYIIVTDKNGCKSEKEIIFAEE